MESKHRKGRFGGSGKPKAAKTDEFSKKVISDPKLYIANFPLH